MSQPRPEFHLRRVLSDGSSSEAVVYPLHELPDDTQMSRRGFLGTGVAVGAVVTALSGCGRNADENEEAAQNQEAPRPAPALREAHHGDVCALAVSFDGKLLVSAVEQYEAMKVWSLPEGNLVRKLTGGGQVGAVTFSADGNLICSGSLEKTIKLWSVSDGSLVRTLTGHDNRIRALASSGTLLASGSADRTIKLWSLPEGGVLQTLSGHTGEVLSLAFSPDRTLLASGAHDNTVRLWSMPDGRLLQTIRVGRGPDTSPDAVNTLRFLPDGRRLLAATWWIITPASVPDGTLLAPLTGPNGLLPVGTRIVSLAVSSDARLLAAATEISVKLCSVTENRVLNTLEDPFAGHGKSLAMTPDDKLLIWGHNRGAITLWDLPGGTLRSRLSDPDVAPRFVPPPPSGGGGGGGPGKTCSCNTVCTCVPVRRRR